MKRKFKVGDRVKIIATKRFGAAAKRTGKVSKADPMPNMSFPYTVQLDYDGTSILDTQIFGEDELQILDNALQKLKKRYEQK